MENEVEGGVYCSECGNIMELKATDLDEKGRPMFLVMPCKSGCYSLERFIENCNSFHGTDDDGKPTPWLQ